MKPRSSRFWLKFGILSVAALELVPYSYSDIPDSIVPQKYTAEKYRPIWEKLPFTKPTVENVAEAGPGGNFALLGWSRDIQKRDFVILFDKQSQKYYHLTKDQEADQEGYTLVSLQKDEEDYTRSSAVIQTRDGSKVTVHFDPAILNAQPVAAQPQVNPEDNPGGAVTPPPPVEQAQPAHNIPLRIRRRRINPPPQATP